MNLNIYDSLNSTDLIKSVKVTSKLQGLDGKPIDTSSCKNYTVKIPIGSSLPFYSDYIKIKEGYGADIYNKSDPFFNDICYSFSDENGDVPTKMRREIFNVSILCTSNCTFKGIDSSMHKQAVIPEK